MLTRAILSNVRIVMSEGRRNLSVSIPALAKASDPIQQLFLDKIRDYGKKSKDGAMVDPTPESQHELKSELERIAKQFGGAAGVDMTKFPDFKFEEPKLDPINASVDSK